jgi:tetratricopeptide (TPR) repeat protein
MNSSIYQDALFIKACHLADKGELKAPLDIFNCLEITYSREPLIKFFIADLEYKRNNLELARKNAEKALDLDPSYKKVNHLLGNILRDQGYFELAKNAYDRELYLNPDYPDALNDKGILFFNMDSYDEASEMFDLAIKTDPTYADPYSNKALIYIRKKEFKGAAMLLEAAIKLKTHNYEAIGALANLKKHLCDFEDAWKLYEFRFELELKSEKKYFTKPVWSNQAVENKRIYLYGEQGIGDQILFGTMFREAFETKNNFIVLIDKRLTPIFSRSFKQYKNVDFISIGDEVDESIFDMQLAIGDLGKFFRKSRNDFKKKYHHYLLSSDEKRNTLRAQLITEKKIICGVAWKSASNKVGSDKSLKLNQLEPILNLKDISFVDLQYGDTLEERQTLKRESGLNINKIEAIDNFNDIDSLASLIDACDFVVTISNVTAHIAGALGKKVFLIVPYSKGRCWYWHDGLKQSLWYPSIQIFSQTEAGDWLLPINEIKEKIIEEISHA